MALGHHPQVVAGTDLDLVEGPVRDPPWRTRMFLGHQQFPARTKQLRPLGDHRPVRHPPTEVGLSKLLPPLAVSECPLRDCPPTVVLLDDVGTAWLGQAAIPPDRRRCRAARSEPERAPPALGADSSTSTASRAADRGTAARAEFSRWRGRGRPSPPGDRHASCTPASTGARRAARPRATAVTSTTAARAICAQHSQARTARILTTTQVVDPTSGRGGDLSRPGTLVGKRPADEVSQSQRRGDDQHEQSAQRAATPFAMIVGGPAHGPVARSRFKAVAVSVAVTVRSGTGRMRIGWRTLTVTVMDGPLDAHRPGEAGLGEERLGRRGRPVRVEGGVAGGPEAVEVDLLGAGTGGARQRDHGRWPGRPRSGRRRRPCRRP